MDNNGEGDAPSTRFLFFFSNLSIKTVARVFSKDVEVYSSEMEAAGCNSSLDKDQMDTALAIMSSTGGASFLVCSLAVTLVVVFKLYKQFAYRLALYQVIAAMLFGVASCLEVLFINYEKNPAIYTNLCRVIASVFFNLEWVKLMFTTCVTFHLFCFAVFNKNFKKLEILYIVCSTAVPAVVASIPYITHSYGRAGAWCWIQDWKENCPSDIFEVGNVETFVLWYGPAFIVLLLDSVAMVVMGTVLACRAYRNIEGEHLLSTTQGSQERAQSDAPAPRLSNHIFLLRRNDVRISLVQRQATPTKLCSSQGHGGALPGGGTGGGLCPRIAHCYCQVQDGEIRWPGGQAAAKAQGELQRRNEQGFGHLQV